MTSVAHRYMEVSVASEKASRSTSAGHGLPLITHIIIYKPVFLE